MGLMDVSGDNFRLVFWTAVIPAAVAIFVLLFGIKERASKQFATPAIATTA
jgi:hypothetical protein